MAIIMINFSLIGALNLIKIAMLCSHIYLMKSMDFLRSFLSLPRSSIQPSIR